MSVPGQIICNINTQIASYFEGMVNQNYPPELQMNKKVQVGNDQEKAQSEKDSHSKNRGGKNQTYNKVLRP